MFKCFVHWFVFRLIRLFYSRIEVRGLDRIPRDAPVIFVLNHPNGVLDPVLLMTALGRQVTFLSKSTLFAYPLSRWASESFGALPVFRTKDIGRRGGAVNEADMATRNETTFARGRELLAKGGAMALFPEGTTHSEPRLLKLRTGAARLALSAADKFSWASGLVVVPVGLWYESKTRFRTPALLVGGEPLRIDDFRERYLSDPRAAARHVTDHLEERLAAVVLQAENRNLLKAIPAVAAWTAPNGHAGGLAARHAWAATLLSSYEKLKRRNPDRLDFLAGRIRRYATLLRSFGITDPWQLEETTLRPRRAVGRGLVLLLLGLPALVGVILSFVPHRLSGTLARHVKRGKQTQAGMVKIVGGAVLELLTWVIEAAIVGAVFGPWWGFALFCCAPLFAYAAVRWVEMWSTFVDLLRVLRFRGPLVGLRYRLEAVRKELAQHVIEAVESVRESADP